MCDEFCTACEDDSSTCTACASTHYLDDSTDTCHSKNHTLAHLYRFTHLQTDLLINICNPKSLSICLSICFLLLGCDTVANEKGCVSCDLTHLSWHEGRAWMVDTSVEGAEAACLCTIDKLIIHFQQMHDSFFFSCAYTTHYLMLCFSMSNKLSLVQ